MFLVLKQTEISSPQHCQAYFEKYSILLQTIKKQYLYKNSSKLLSIFNNPYSTLHHTKLFNTIIEKFLTDFSFQLTKWLIIF
jgi:hypothetical protein